MDISILLSHALQSDQFFNAPHPHYDALMETVHGTDQYPTLDTLMAALYKDAETYCEENDGDPTWYVRDFFRRV